MFVVDAAAPAQDVSDCSRVITQSIISTFTVQYYVRRKGRSAARALQQDVQRATRVCF